MNKLMKCPIGVSRVGSRSLTRLSSSDYLRAATSNNTRLAYQGDIRHFQAWGGSLPCSTDIVLQYLRDCAQPFNPRTLTRRLTALKQWHVFQGFPDPTASPLVRKTMAGIFKTHGRPARKALALSREDLMVLVRYCLSQETLAACRNNALLQVGYLGAFRGSELVNIQWEHVHFLPQGMEILVPRSKTDQLGSGQVCAVPYGADLLCAVTALKRWAERSRLKTGPVFCSINRHHQLMRSPLSLQGWGQILKTLVSACQLDQAAHYSTHSLRRGFATAASRQGASFASIKRQGRWRSEKTVWGYIEEGQHFEENAVNSLFNNG